MTAPTTTVFFGETFNLNPDVSEFALLEFAEAASDGQDGDTMQGLASLMRLVKECIAPDELKRFLTLARKKKAGAKELTEVIQSAFGDAAERPTGRPADSTDGPSVTLAKSESSSDATVSRLASRPDLVTALKQTG